MGHDPGMWSEARIESLEIELEHFKKVIRAYVKAKSFLHKPSALGGRFKALEKLVDE